MMGGEGEQAGARVKVDANLRSQLCQNFWHFATPERFTIAVTRLLQPQIRDVFYDLVNFRTAKSQAGAHEKYRQVAAFCQAVHRVLVDLQVNRDIRHFHDLIFQLSPPVFPQWEKPSCFGDITICGLIPLQPRCDLRIFGHDARLPHAFA